MNTLSQKAREQKVIWISNHRGTFARISRELGVSPTFVQEVFWSTRSSRSGDVERRLAEAGAPGFGARDAA